MLKPGDLAPDFTLRAQDRSLVSLKDYRGKNVIILFFPFAFSSVCTKEMAMMRDMLHEFEQYDAVVLAVSVDSLYTLHRWKLEEGYNFQLLSDFNKTVSKKYDSLYKKFVYEMKGVSKRSAFLIDKSGTIQYAEVLENAGEIPDLETLRQKLANL